MDESRPQSVALTISAARERTARNGRKRALVLLAVHVVIAIHVAQWLIMRKTLAPFELNESMFTLEQGAITVGAILMGLILISVLFFGRFFCSWGCHVLALQDGASWLLGKFGIRPPPIRSRLAPFVAIAVAFSMFVWPQIERLIAGTPWPGLRVTTDAQGLGSLVTEDFLRNLPGPLVTTITFLVCGGVMVWLLGSRSFCRIACPYGAVFSVVDRFSVGAIRLTSPCDSCGLCTAHCSSHIQVHEEVKRYGRVVSPNCLKDLDCVKVCPQNALSWGTGAPSFFKSVGESRNAVNPWPLHEELLFLGVAAATTPVFRSLYGEIPFFLAVGLGALLAWGAVMTLRLATQSNVRVLTAQLKRSGRLSEAGLGWLIGASCVALLVAHSAWYRWHESRGRDAWSSCKEEISARGAASHEMTRAAREHLEIVLTAGFWSPPYAHRMLTDVHVWSGRPDLAARHAKRMTEIWPDVPERWAQLGELLDQVGDQQGAALARARAQER